MNAYNLDGIKTGLNKELAVCEGALNAWNNVTFPTKKDGSEFAVFSKNINGARVSADSCLIQPGQNELTVTFNVPYNGWKVDTIKLYNYVRYLKDEKQIAKTGNYIPVTHGLNQVYKFDLEDTKEAIKNRINYLESRIEELKNSIEKAETAYNAFKAAYASALDELKMNCGADDNTLFYAIRDTVKERYPYC
jgi:hypothetical protein